MPRKQHSVNKSEGDGNFQPFWDRSRSNTPIPALCDLPLWMQEEVGEWKKNSQPKRFLKGYLWPLGALWFLRNAMESSECCRSSCMRRVQCWPHSGNSRPPATHHRAESSTLEKETSVVCCYDHIRVTRSLENRKKDEAPQPFCTAQ